MIERLWAEVWEDSALRGLVLMNVLVVIGALVSGEGAMMLMLPYWIQSVVIGLYTTRRIASLKRFRTDGVMIAGRIVPPRLSLRRSVALVFLVHYGFFHLLYFEMMGGLEALGYSGVLLFPSAWSESGLGPVTGFSGLWLALLAAGFLLSEGREHAQHRRADDASRPNIVPMMFTPYARVVPMHVTILFGSLFGGWSAVLIFGVAKTVVEVAILRFQRHLQGSW